MKFKVTDKDGVLEAPGVLRKKGEEIDLRNANAVQSLLAQKRIEPLKSGASESVKKIAAADARAFAKDK